MKFRTLLAGVLLAVGLSACTHTREAYKTADTPDEYAYVLAEHYASLLNQAADLKEKSTTPREAVEAMQKAELAARPVVDKLRPLRTAYLTAKNAQTQAELQAAINEAVLLIADLVRSVRAAAGDPNPQTSAEGIERRILFEAGLLRGRVAA
jgi:ABC-type oligopeptide transport system substrate-binding subunit